MSARPRLAVSACLLGERVRYDGGHKHSRYVTDVLGAHFELVPVCPEVGIGLGVPRPPIHLVRTARGVRARGVEDPRLDVTGALADFGRRAAATQLAGVCGYVLKHGSPSCGLAGVPVHDERGRRCGRGRGVHAQAVARALAPLPLEEEGRLADLAVREAFLERVCAYARWQALRARGLTAGAIAAFHAAHEALLRAHSEAGARRLRALLAPAAEDRPEALGRAYLEGCMATLARPATRRGHARALRHLAAALGPVLDARARAELAACIEDYRTGALPREAPLGLLRHHFRRHPHGEEPVYLRGLPPELLHAPAP